MRASNFLVSALAAAGLASASCKPSNCEATNGVAFGCPTVDKAYVRDAFFLGGRTVALSDGNYTVDQLFVEKLTPVRGVTQPKPLVFLHGGGISGATWLNTPDGRQGWASYFVDQGFQVYLVDIVAVGRSANADTTTFPMTPGTSIEILEEGFSAVERFNTATASAGSSRRGSCPRWRACRKKKKTGEASVHITYDHCIIDYLKQVGGKPEWIKLEDLAIRGNGHFLHQERNSEEIADVVLQWINKADGKGKATR
ncbi:conserved hypothetical protein [Verticillium alfalfae VaMs.102]|uniref:AB hydrolase-1 domain-containing protein n=1 Tax=Verticillium alfalfae (strain VaMs.102 / ATCC MYA-4576 / FGSC 10136) TaxID=526221 RepID=C9S9F1_VERA1|nr:conserved hypothetical protein [Verticillium alfalfae VaMs.102]EEY16014.1 conserved hypothetical protein [Verticillium alfalfae VaMs.102]